MQRPIAIVVQARFASTRLPGKVLAPVMGRPLLAYELERLARVRSPHVIVVATTTNGSDDPVAALAESLGFRAFRGSEDDVLARYSGAADLVGAGVIIRVTADCPVIDPAVVDAVLDRYQREGCDFATNMLEWTYPLGMAVEIFSREVLDSAVNEAREPDEREHVTLFMYRHPERFAICSVRLPIDLTHHRWTVDTPQDLQVISRILSELYPQNPTFHMEEVLQLVGQHPDWAELNQGSHTRTPSYPGMDLGQAGAGGPADQARPDVGA